MIEMMEDYTDKLEERVKRTTYSNVQLVQDDTALNSEPVKTSSAVRM